MDREIASVANALAGAVQQEEPIMIRHLSVAVPLTVLLAVTLGGCGVSGGGSSCPSETADLNPPSNGTTCSLAPGTTATITVGICAKCTDTSPVCDVEQVSETEFGLDPLVHKCAENQGCDTSGCSITPNQVICSLRTPVTPGTYTLQVGGVGGYQEQFTVDGSGSTTCTL